MTMKRDKDDEFGRPPKSSEEEQHPQHEVRHTVRMITAKDAGWITPTAFVAPVTMVPIDPPRPLKKKSPPTAG